MWGGANRNFRRSLFLGSSGVPGPGARETLCGAGPIAIFGAQGPEDPKIEKIQDFRPGLKFSSENETFNRE